MGLLLFSIGYRHGKDAVDGWPEDDSATAASSGEEAIEKVGGVRDTRDKVGGVRCARKSSGVEVRICHIVAAGAHSKHAVG